MAQFESSDRETLGFVSEARLAFIPLVSKYDFVELGTDLLYSIAYHGPHGWLTVIHDRLSYELDIALLPSEAPETERPYGMADLIRVTDTATADRYRCFAATTVSGVHTGLERLAHGLYAYGERALAGDPSFLTQLQRGRLAAVEQFAFDRSRAGIDAEAAEAVRREDWTRVVAIYEPFENRLNRVESKRLELARKRLAET